MNVLNLAPLLASKDMKKIHIYLSPFLLQIFFMYKESIEKRGRDGFPMFTKKEKKRKKSEAYEKSKKQNKAKQNLK